MKIGIEMVCYQTFNQFPMLRISRSLNPTFSIISPFFVRFFFSVPWHLSKLLETIQWFLTKFYFLSPLLGKFESWPKWARILNLNDDHNNTVGVVLFCFITMQSLELSCQESDVGVCDRIADIFYFIYKCNLFCSKSIWFLLLLLVYVERCT